MDIGRRGITIVNIIAILQTLFYLCSVPVHLAVRVDGLKAGAGLAVFERRAARRRAEGELKDPKPNEKAPDVRRAIRVLWRLRVERLELTGRVATGDAAATALMCGALNGLTRSLRGRVRRMEVAVAPDFSAEAADIQLWGMIRARSGQIIWATLRVWTEEAFPWISTRLKTS